MRRRVLVRKGGARVFGVLRVVEAGRGLGAVPVARLLPVTDLEGHKGVMSNFGREKWIIKTQEREF